MDEVISYRIHDEIVVVPGDPYQHVIDYLVHRMYAQARVERAAWVSYCQARRVERRRG